MESNNCLHSPLRLSYSVGRLRLSRRSRYDMAGEIMESALFWTLSISSLRLAGGAWWKTGAQYSSTGLIVVQLDGIYPLKYYRKKLSFDLCNLLIRIHLKPPEEPEYSASRYISSLWLAQREKHVTFSSTEVMELTKIINSFWL